MGFPPMFHFQNDHLRNSHTEKSIMFLRREQVPEGFTIPERELVMALKSTYALCLKKRDTCDANKRVFYTPVVNHNSMQAVTHVDVERYWFFDPTIPDTLLLALADLCQHTSGYHSYRLLETFNITKTQCKRIVAHILHEYDDIFTVTWGPVGNQPDCMHVYYEGPDGVQKIIKHEHPLDVLIDIRADMLEKTFNESLKEILKGGLDDPGQDTQVSTTGNNETFAQIDLIETKGGLIEKGPNDDLGNAFDVVGVGV